MTLVESTAIELTKKRLFTPAQKEKIKRRSLLQESGVQETYEAKIQFFYFFIEIGST